MEKLRVLGVKESRVRVVEGKGQRKMLNVEWKNRGFEEASEMLKNFKELKVWQKAYQLCLEIYKITASFPDEEKFGITAQIRKSSLSVPSNIAEGYGRKSIADYVKFLYIAYGSNCELETQAMISGDLNYMSGDKTKFIIEEIHEVERMLKALIKALEKRI